MGKKQIELFKKYKPLMKQLVIKDIKLKYRRSFLGYIWSILNPLMIMIIMVIVFRQMFRFNIENYPVYLIIGSTLFSFMSDATSEAMWSIIGNSALLKKTYVPKYIFAISKITSSFVNTLFSLGAMLIVFVVCGVKFNFYMFWIATVYKGNIIKNLIMDCQSYTKYRPNETTGGIFVSWRRKEELPTGA